MNNQKEYTYYRIADLTVAMDSFGRTVKQAEPYRIDAAEAVPDIVIRSDAEGLHARQPHLDLNACEYLSTGFSFYHQLLDFDGMLLHSSAVVMDGRAYLFSAPCGTGKSTHTSLWLKEFGDRVQLLNDDKPALRLLDGTWYAYGTPWSGKYDLNLNLKAPLAGICVLRRGEVNKIEQIGGFDAIHALAEQTSRGRDPALMSKVLSRLDSLIRAVPVWRLECNMDPEAAHVSYRAMSGESL